MCGFGKVSQLLMFLKPLTFPGEVRFFLSWWKSREIVCWIMDYSISSGWSTRSKNFKMPFFGDISNSCHWVTDMGLEPHQKKCFGNISKSIAARPLRSFDTNKGVADISVVLWPKFFHQFTTDLWLISGENFIKIS